MHCSPTGAVPGNDHSKAELLNFRDCLLDQFFVGVDKMQAADECIERSRWKQLLRMPADIYDAGMRTARENGQTFSFHVGNQEALVHDQRIWLPLSRARALEMVAQATLEALSRNLAAQKKRAIEYALRLARFPENVTGATEIATSGNFLKRNDSPFGSRMPRRTKTPG
jgi:hypothetical protein